MSCVADSIPKEGIEFGYCGINQITIKSFTLYNPLSNNVKFEIVVDNIPFEFSTLKGKLLLYKFKTFIIFHFNSNINNLPLFLFHILYMTFIYQAYIIIGLLIPK